MSAKEIAEQLVAFCRAGKNMDSINTLYAEHVESVEAAASPQGDRLSKGIAAVRAKNTWWEQNHEVHSAEVEGPWPHGEEKFAVRFSYDVTVKQSGDRIKMDEIAIFTLEDGKIVKEEFFYDMG